MSRANWTPPLRDLMKDPIVIQTFDSLAGYLKAQFEAQAAAQTAVEAERGLEDHTAIAPQTTNPDAIDQEGGIRWMRGPWLLNADGNVTGEAVLTARLTASVNNYAPVGIEKAIGLELDASAAVSMTGLAATQQRRVMFVINRSLFAMTFPHESASSRAEYRFDLGATGESLVLQPGKLMWLYYDVHLERWHLLAVPAIEPSDLPESLRSTSAFPVDYDWFGARINGNSTTWEGVGEAGSVIVAASAMFNDPLYGVGRDITTPAAIGTGVGMLSQTTQQVAPQHDPTRMLLIRTGPDITNIRIWAVLTNTNPTDADDMGNPAEYMGFRYSTTAGDPGWVGVCRKVGPGQAVTGLVAAIAADTVYKLLMRKSGNTVYFSVNGGAEVSLSTSVPPATLGMWWGDKWYTQANVAKTITWFRHWVKLAFTP